jgi:malate dehydrogenase (oxaloacetate-decarboxylating)(NADP+)
LGRPEVVRRTAKELGVRLSEKITIVDPAAADAARERYALRLFELRGRKGLTPAAARRLVLQPIVFGALMVEAGDADCLVAGAGVNYPDSLRPVLEVVGLQDGVRRVSAYYIVLLKNDVLFFSDTAVNVDPDAETLAEIARLTARACASFHLAPKTAFLSFSNFGSVRCPQTEKVRRAVELLRRDAPDLVADGEMQAETALVPELQEREHPFCRLHGKANVLIFPDLNSANIAYKLMQHAGGAETIGPVTVGFRKPVNVLNSTSDAADIVRLTAMTVLEAQKATP